MGVVCIVTMVGTWDSPSAMVCIFPVWYMIFLLEFFKQFPPADELGVTGVGLVLPLQGLMVSYDCDVYTCYVWPEVSEGPYDA